jgi:hypothetical protein
MKTLDFTACLDCFVMACHPEPADFFAYHYGERDVERMAQVSRTIGDVMKTYHGRFAESDKGDPEEFSTEPCEICHAREGGFRATLVLLVEEKA